METICCDRIWGVKNEEFGVFSSLLSRDFCFEDIGVI